ncbi:MAG: hypothetical protein OEQ29_08900 [Alphaproteobacteria bacterium]|nr:hypothetical protein [Alphaproteobacteria bacterium]
MPVTHADKLALVKRYDEAGGMNMTESEWELFLDDLPFKMFLALVAMKEDNRKADRAQTHGQ